MPKPQTCRPQVSDKDLIADTAHQIHFEAWRSWSRDQLLCHPRDAIELCRLVRHKLHRPTLSDFQILATYLNAFKRSRFTRHSPTRARSPSAAVSPSRRRRRSD